METKEALEATVYGNQPHTISSSFRSEENLLQKLQELTSEDLAVFNELGAIPIHNACADAFIIVLCLAGKGTCTLEGITYEVGPNDMVISHPKMFVADARASIDFKCEGLLLSPAFFESILFLGGNAWNALTSIMKQPVLHMTDKEMERSCFNIEIIRKKLSMPKLPHHEEAIKLLLHSMIYEFYDCLAPKLQAHPAAFGYTASEALFRRFTMLLSDETPHHHDVAFYADRLCVSRKYLSAVCKQQSGKTCADLIHDVTVSHIRQSLLSTDKTIKEIAMETGFQNLSFFGKFVKRELGMSPRAYRRVNSK